MAKAITSHDVARAAGVSQATVSRALRNLPGTAPRDAGRRSPGRRRAVVPPQRLGPEPGDPEHAAGRCCRRGADQPLLPAARRARAALPRPRRPANRARHRPAGGGQSATPGVTVDDLADGSYDGVVLMTTLRTSQTSARPHRTRCAPRAGQPRPRSPRVTELHRGQRSWSDGRQCAGRRSRSSACRGDPRPRRDLDRPGTRAVAAPRPAGPGHCAASKAGAACRVRPRRGHGRSSQPPRRVAATDRTSLRERRTRSRCAVGGPSSPATDSRGSHGRRIRRHRRSGVAGHRPDHGARRSGPSRSNRRRDVAAGDQP